MRVKEATYCLLIGLTALQSPMAFGQLEDEYWLTEAERRATVEPTPLEDLVLLEQLANDYDAVAEDVRQATDFSLQQWLVTNRPQTIDDLKRWVETYTDQTWEDYLEGDPVEPPVAVASDFERFLPSLRSTPRQRHVTVVAGYDISLHNHRIFLMSPDRFFSDHRTDRTPLPFIRHEIVDGGSIARDPLRLAILLRDASLSSDLIIVNAHGNPGLQAMTSKEAREQVAISADFFRTYGFDFRGTTIVLSGCCTAAEIWPDYMADEELHGHEVEADKRVPEAIMSTTRADAVIGTTEVVASNTHSAHILGMFGGGTSIGRAHELGYRYVTTDRIVTREEFGPPTALPSTQRTSATWADGSSMLPRGVHEAWETFQDLLTQEPSNETPFWWHFLRPNPEASLEIDFAENSPDMLQVARRGPIYDGETTRRLYRQLRRILPQTMRRHFRNRSDFFIFLAITGASEDVHRRLNNLRERYVTAVEQGVWSLRRVRAYERVGYRFSTQGIRVPLFTDYSLDYAALMRYLLLGRSIYGLPALMMESADGTVHPIYPGCERPTDELTRVSTRSFSVPEQAHWARAGVVPHTVRPHSVTHSLFIDTHAAMVMAVAPLLGGHQRQQLMEVQNDWNITDERLARIRWLLENAVEGNSWLNLAVPLTPTELLTFERIIEEGTLEPKTAAGIASVFAEKGAEFHRLLPQLVEPLGPTAVEATLSLALDPWHASLPPELLGSHPLFQQSWRNMKHVVDRFIRDPQSLVVADVQAAYSLLHKFVMGIYGSNTVKLAQSAFAHHAGEGSEFHRVISGVRGRNVMPMRGDLRIAANEWDINETPAANDEQQRTAVRILLAYREVVANSPMVVIQPDVQAHLAELDLFLKAVVATPTGGSIVVDLFPGLIPGQGELVFAGLPVDFTHELAAFHTGRTTTNYGPDSVAKKLLEAGLLRVEGWVELNRLELVQAVERVTRIPGMQTGRATISATKFAETGRALGLLP